MTLPADQNVGYTFVAALFFGLYLSTLFHCLRWLIFTDEGWKVRKSINWTMVSVTIILCILSALCRALDLQNAMVQVGNGKSIPPPPPPGTVFASVLPWSDVVTCTASNISTLLADAVLIYRCWIIYNKSRRVIVFPIFLWVGGVLLTALEAYWQIVQSASILKAWQPVNMSVGPGTILVPFWASTIVLNSYATCMIVRRIYLVAKESKESTAIHQLQFVMRILIESGSLYVAVAIAHFVAWWTPTSYAISIISSINLSVTGIAFNLILIRSAQHRVEEMTKAEIGLGISAVSGIQFNVNHGVETKASVNTTPAIVFRRHEVSEDSGSMLHGNTEINTASVV